MTSKYIVSQDKIDEILNKLQSIGYQLIGPTIRDKTIIYDNINEISDLPVGWTDKQGKASYRIEARQDKALFGYNVGPCTWKKFLFPPKQKLFTVDKSSENIKINQVIETENKLAFIGVRPCELHAIKIQDKIFSDTKNPDTVYTNRRKNLFIIAVNCTVASDTCFCTTMKTGPKVDSGFDLALTEIASKDKHYFVLEVGSELGDKLIQGLSLKNADEKELKEAKDVCDNLEKNIKIRFDNSKVKKLLQSNLESPLWDELEERCLSCANCTLVCPTCFCYSVEDTTNLNGTISERNRRWDSCFSGDFTYMHGSGQARKSTKSKYRQWMTHKLANWHDQFGTSGCVGCGRCISWCPVGIDLTEEVNKLQELGE